MTATAEKLELLLTRTFDAPVAKVYRIWTAAEIVRRWWGPKDFTVPHMDWDFRVGGAYRACIKGPDFEAWHGGRFVEIAAEERLRFTFAWEEGSGPTIETMITVTWAARGAQTVQTFHQTPFVSAQSRDSHVQGWTQFLDKEERFLVQELSS